MIDHLLLILEVIILVYMLKLDRENREDIKAFLTSRTAWYARRALVKPTKEKPPNVPGGGSSVELVLLTESDDGQREADELRLADGGLEDPAVRDAPAPNLPGPLGDGDHNG